LFREPSSKSSWVFGRVQPLEIFEDIVGDFDWPIPEEDPRRLAEMALAHKPANRSQTFLFLRDLRALAFVAPF
jgi:hypothetical protein